MLLLPAYRAILPKIQTHNLIISDIIIFNKILVRQLKNMSDVDVHELEHILSSFSNNRFNEIANQLTSLGYPKVISKDRYFLMRNMMSIFYKEKLLKYPIHHPLTLVAKHIPMSSSTSSSSYDVAPQPTLQPPATYQPPKTSHSSTSHTYTDEECDKFIANPSKNPRTNYTIKPSGATYKNLEQQCKHRRHLNNDTISDKLTTTAASSAAKSSPITPPIYTVDECKAFLANPSKNPRSHYTIKSTGATYRSLVADCGEPHQQLATIKKTVKTAKTPIRKRSTKTLSQPPISTDISTTISDDINASWYNIKKVPTNVSFDISNLICSRFSVSYDEFINRSINNCSSISGKIAESMIRVAATRIFSDPSQSIMELPVNSIDSYRKMKNPNNASIGKFGMGFFSFLYWLIGYPQRTLYIYSKYNDNGDVVQYIFKINEINGSLRGIFESIDPYHFIHQRFLNYALVKNHGTAIYLYDQAFGGGSFPSSDFTNQVGRLNFIQDVTIHIGYITTMGSVPKGDIEMVINNKNVIIVDGAEGIRLPVLFNSLLIPSISTKTLMNTNTIGQPMTDSRVIKISSWRSSVGLMITVGDIVVVKDLKVKNDARDVIYVISLPLNTPLPVSRDDIVIEPDSMTYHLLNHIFIELANICISSNLSVNQYFKYLQAYALYSGQPIIHQLIDNAYKNVISRPHLILLPNQYMVDLLRPHISNHYDLVYLKGAVASSSYQNLDIAIKEYLALKSFDGYRYFKNAVIVPINNPKNIVEEYKYIFVNENIIIDAGWEDRLAASYDGRILRTYNTTDSLIPPELWDKLRLSPSFDDVSNGGYGNIDVSFLLNNLSDELNNLYSIIEAKLNSYSSDIKINIGDSSNLDFLKILNALTDVDYTFVLCIMAISYFKMFAEHIDDIKEYIHHLMIFMSTFKFDTTYGRELELRIVYGYVLHEKFEYRSYGEDSAYNFIKNNIKSSYKYDIIDTIKNHIDTNPSYRAYMREACVLSLKVNLPHQLIVWKEIYNSTLYSKINLLSSKILSLDIPNIDDESKITLINQAIENMSSAFELSNVLKILNLYINKSNIKGSDPTPSASSDPSSTYFIKTKHAIDNILKYDGVNYVYREIRKRYSKEFFNEWLMLQESNDIIKKYIEIFFNVMVKSLNIYIQSFDNKKISKHCSVAPQIVHPHVFTANQLIDYTFSHKISPIQNVTELFELLPLVSQHQVSSHRPQFQSVQIAVNDGTTKAFVPAVLTELIQNSTDAIRQSIFEGANVNQRIDISICKSEDVNEIVVTDYVGIPYNALLSLWIPFLSSKSTQDLMSTGEMGTGFFNVYRQPYTKHVLMITNNIIIKATPIIDQKRVIDIKYEVARSKKTLKGTSIRIVIDDLPKEMIIRMNVDVHLYVHNMLSFSEYPVYLNNKKVHINTINIYESNVGIAKIMKVPSTSIISTNGIPLTDLIQYVSGIFPGKISVDLYMGIIIDIKKDYYIPVQSRNKLAKMSNDTNLSTFKNFILSALYHCLLYKIDTQPELFTKYLPNAHSVAQIDQLVGWSGSRMIGINNINATSMPYIKTTATFDIFINYDIILYISLESIINNLMNMYRNNGVNVTYDNTEKYLNLMIDPSEITARSIVHKWFDNKQHSHVDVAKKINIAVKGEDAKLLVIIRNLEKILNHFIDTYYKIGRVLKFQGLPVFTDQPPVLEFMILDRSEKGHYSIVENQINFNVAHWANLVLPFMNSFNEFIRLYKLDKNKAIQYFRLNGNIKNIIGNTYPANTLIHELQHSILRTDHVSGGTVDIHGINDLTYDGKTNAYSFDDGCRWVYNHILSHGFLDEFMSNWE